MSSVSQAPVAIADSRRCRSCDRRGSARDALVRGRRASSTRWIGSRRPAASSRGRSRPGNLPRPFELFVTPLVESRLEGRRVAAHRGGREARVRHRSRAEVADRRRRWPARQRRVARLALRRSSRRCRIRPATSTSRLLQAVAEGLTLAEFDGGTYKTARSDGSARRRGSASCGPAGSRYVAGESRLACEGAVARGRLLGECSNLARELANEPGNTLTPREFADRARDDRQWRRRVASRSSTRSRSRSSAWACCSASPAAAASRRG